MFRKAQVLTGLTAAWIASAASGQIVNGDFSTGSMAPWVVTPTPAGVSLLTGVSPFDIDGPGPLPVSPAARFLVGRTQPNAGWQGIALTQGVPLIAGAAYELGLNWAVDPLVNVYSQSGGRFELILDGVVLATATAPVTVPQVRTYGRVSVFFTAAAGGVRQVGVRITRDVPAGEEVLQYIDNVTLTTCYPDCNADGALNLADFGCFQTKYALANPYADCNGDGALNLADFGCFQTKFALGCP